MKKTMMIGLLGLLLGSAVGSTHAQDTQPVQKPVSIKLGIYLPNNGDLKDALGSTWFAAGVDYAFNKSATAAPILPLAYVDYTGASKHGVNGNIIGVGVGVRAYANRATNTTVAPFYGAGIGVDFIHASGNGQTKNNTQLAGKINAGLELNSGPFVEVAYQIIPQKVANVHLDGFNIMVGDRF